MKIEKLIKSLEEQERNLKSFLECIMDKQKSIISNDIEGLEHSLLIESQLLNAMEEQSKKISNVIGDLAKEYSVNLTENSVSEFLNSVNLNADTNVKVIRLLQNSVRDLISKASRVSSQNKVLIEHSRNFIKETINSLAALTNNQLLDKRI